MEHIRFIPPTNPTEVLFIFRAPPLSYTANIFTLPFTATAWATFFSLVLFSAVLTYVVAILEWKRSSKTDDKQTEIYKPSLCDVVFLECSILAQRGSTFQPKSSIGRAILLQIITLCFYMYTGFSAYILVLLQSTSESITDLPSLYESKMEMGVHNITYNRYYFTVSVRGLTMTFPKVTRCQIWRIRRMA